MDVFVGSLEPRNLSSAFKIEELVLRSEVSLEFGYHIRFWSLVLLEMEGTDADKKVLDRDLNTEDVSPIIDLHHDNKSPKESSNGHRSPENKVTHISSQDSVGRRSSSGFLAKIKELTIHKE